LGGRCHTYRGGRGGGRQSFALYDPWGTVLRSTGSLPDWRFQGSFADTATGLAWSIARWYGPASGTFTSEDTLLGDPASPASRHLYAYAGGDPVGGWDPGGRASTTADFSSSESTGWCDTADSRMNRELDGLSVKARAKTPIIPFIEYANCKTHIDSQRMLYGGPGATSKVPRRWYTVKVTINSVKFEGHNGAYVGAVGFAGEWGFEVWRWTPNVWIRVNRYSMWEDEQVCMGVVDQDYCSDAFAVDMHGVWKSRKREIWGPTQRGDRIVARVFINIRAGASGGWATVIGEMADITAELSW
jgi:RHS repeat-associated protein